MGVPHFGVSFSLHRCNELGLNGKTLLEAGLKELSFRRFRLMSYWDIHEPKAGAYNFHDLDWQMDLVNKYGGEVSLALGVRQPRWPEWHMPQWATSLPATEWYEALYRYIEKVVARYRQHPALASWQLENEALLKEFGKATDFNRHRLIYERDLVKRLDPYHPLIMTLSDSWGIPWRGPRPDLYGMSLYRATINKNGQLRHSRRPAIFYRSRRAMVRLYTGRDIFIHELQAEPWLAKGVKQTPLEEQLSRMNPRILHANVLFAQKTGAHPIDLWGLEWWYWLLTQQNHSEMWQAVKALHTI